MFFRCVPRVIHKGFTYKKITRAQKKTHTPTQMVYVLEVISELNFYVFNQDWHLCNFTLPLAQQAVEEVNMAMRHYGIRRLDGFRSYSRWYLSEKPNHEVTNLKLIEEWDLEEGNDVQRHRISFYLYRSDKNRDSQ